MDEIQAQYEKVVFIRNVITHQAREISEKGATPNRLDELRALLKTEAEQTEIFKSKLVSR